MVNNIKKGIFFAALTSFISGVSIFYNKQIISNGIDPLVLNIIKNGGVSIVLTCIILLSLVRKKNNLSSRIPWKKMVFIGIIGGGIPFYLFFEGIQHVSAVNANFIHKTLFLWVVMFAIPVLGETVTKWQVTGYLLVAGSNLFFSNFGTFTFNTPTLMIFIATILWAIENVIVKKMLKNTESVIIAWGRMLFGSLTLLTIALLHQKFSLLFHISWYEIVPISLSVILLTVYIISWYKALQFAPVTLVTSILILATPITNILNATIHKHGMPSVQIWNSILSLMGVVLITILARHKTTHIPTYQ